MKNIWRDYWKGQTYNASALGTLFPIRTTSGCSYLKHGMLSYKTSGCCDAEHGDVVRAWGCTDKQI